ncbi:MAG: heme-copper oxidase subunit III [Pyrinomonadaceae bacterium]
MDIGTVEIIDGRDDQKPKRPGVSGPSQKGGSGGGKNPGGGGGDRPDDSKPTSPELFVPDKSRILTAFLLLVVMMTFGGLMAAYVVIATNNVAEWQPFNLPLQVWISTALILISSLAFHFGKTAVDRNDQPSAKKWFLTTTVLGAAFISSQILAWVELNGRGLYMRGNPYAGFFYILTAVHAVHVLGGITALGSILLRSLNPTERPAEIVKRQTIAQVVGWYWHFMGTLWLVLFILLGFWK